MASQVLVLFCSCFILVASHHQDGALMTPLSSHTHNALQALDALPSDCSRDAQLLILEEEHKYQQLYSNCSRGKLAFHIAELLTDSTYYGFNLLTHGSALFDDVKICLQKKCFLDKVVCVVKRLPTGSWDAVDLGVGTAAYVLDLMHVVPKIVKEIRHCRHSQTVEYQRFLEHQVERARHCLG